MLCYHIVELYCQRWNGSISYIGDHRDHHILPHQAAEIWQIQPAGHMITSIYSEMKYIFYHCTITIMLFDCGF